MNERSSFALTALALGLLGAAALVIQPYSADWPGTAYARTSRQYLRAAIRQDSVRLTELSASPAPVRWALRAARTYPESLRHWRRRIAAFTGEQAGDTMEVYVYPVGGSCDEAPIVLRFIGTGRSARVAAASSTCWDL